MTDKKEKKINPDKINAMDKEWTEQEIKNSNIFGAYANNNPSSLISIWDDYEKSLNSKKLDSEDVSLRTKLYQRGFEKVTTKALDVYSNPDAGYGHGTGSPQEGGMNFHARHLTRNFLELNQAYRGDAIFAKIIDSLSSEMFKKGIEIDSELTTAEITELEEAYEDCVPELEKAVKYSDLFGLTVCVPFIKGQFNKTSLERPLDLDSIDKGDFLGLKTLTKWQGCMPIMLKLVERPSKSIRAEEVGEPLYFDVWFSNTGTHYKVHRSWLMVFITNDLPGIEKDIEQRSGVSSYERLDLPLKNYNATLNYIMSLLQMSTQRVLKLEGITGYEQMTARGQENFKKRMEQIGRATRLWNVLVLGEEDEFDYKTANFAGLKELVTVAQENLSASSSMPMNKLFGKSPSGLNNSSMENITDFYDLIEKRQKTVLKPNLQKLLYILYRNLFNESPKGDKVRFKFKSLWSLNEQDKALIIERKSRAVEKAFTNNAITVKEYLQELKELGRVSDSFTNITDETFASLESAGISDYRFSDFERQRVQRGKVAEDKDIMQQAKEHLTKDELKYIYKLVSKNKIQFKDIKDEIINS